MIWNVFGGEADFSIGRAMLLCSVVFCTLALAFITFIVKTTKNTKSTCSLIFFIFDLSLTKKLFCKLVYEITRFCTKIAIAQCS